MMAALGLLLLVLYGASAVVVAAWSALVLVGAVIGLCVVTVHARAVADHARALDRLNRIAAARAAYLTAAADAEAERAR